MPLLTTLGPTEVWCEALANKVSFGPYCIFCNRCRFSRGVPGGYLEYTLETEAVDFARSHAEKEHDWTPPKSAGKQ